MAIRPTDTTRAAVLAAALAVLLAGAAETAAAADEPPEAPRKVVEVALGEVMRILNDTGDSTARRRDRITAVAYANFDFATMGKLVVARPWRKFTEEQRAQFVVSFKTLLARSYGRRLERYDRTQVAVVGEVAEQRGDVTVLSKIVGGQFDGATMDYRMREKKGKWLAIDVVIEGISLVSNFRSQFKPILAEGGAELLLTRMREKNDALQQEIAVEEGGAQAQPVSDAAAN